jgi:cytochrome c-type biogenesis protein CcmH
MRSLFAALVLVLLAFPAIAVEPDEILDDPVLETRAREISKNLRCLVCQNQSIDDSNAELARDLRVLVRERLLAGDSDTSVVDYVVSRYGDFVLLKPPFKGTTYVLWIGPAAIAIAGILAFILFFRRRQGAVETPVPLSAEEKTRLEALMKEDAR